MKLIVGLGNPGKQYENTRHNVGFVVLDTLKQWKSELAWKTDKGRECEEAIVKMPNDETVILARPQTMMNSSGRSVSKLLNFYKIAPKDLLVIHDDLDLKLGEFKLQLAKGPQAHNGVNSVEKDLATAEFWRLRVGVDSREPANRTSGEEYVLQAFRPEEQMIIDKLIKDSLLSEFSQWLLV